MWAVYVQGVEVYRCESQAWALVQAGVREDRGETGVTVSRIPDGWDHV